jgi:hypothetical protein
MINKMSFTGDYYKDNTEFEKFLLYRIIYPIFNKIGLNRKFNLLRHRLGLYAELSNGLCQWCGENHREIPISQYKEKKLNEQVLGTLSTKNKEK